MANALFLSPYYSDLATVAYGGGSVAGFPATNMQTTNPNKVARSTGSPPQSITLDFGSGGSIAATACAIVGSNFSSSATWAIGASNTSTANAIASPSLTAVTAGTSVWIGSKPTTPGLPFTTAFATWANTTAYRYWAITVTDSGPSYFDIGRLMFGTIWQPALNIDQNISIGYESADLVGRSAWNQYISERRGSVARRLGLTFSTASESEARSFAGVVRQVGAGGDFFFAIDPADTSNFSEWAGQFYFAGMPTMSGVPLFIGGRPAWAVQATISEVL
jgi:hypothetical protein